MRCGVVQGLDNFYKRSKAADGRNPACKSCLAERRRERRGMSPADREAELAALVNRESKTCSACGVDKPRAEFRSKLASRDRMAPKCRSCESEWHRAHYERTKDKRLEQTARWYEANRERKNATSRAYHRNNAERLAEAAKAWLAANPGYMAEYNRRRRAIRRNATIGPVDLEALWTGRCGICDEPMDRDLRHPDPMSKSVDHIMPLARGGSHSQDNLQWAHLICNIRKGARLPVLSNDDSGAEVIVHGDAA